MCVQCERVCVRDCVLLQNLGFDEWVDDKCNVRACGTNLGLEDNLSNTRYRK